MLSPIFMAISCKMKKKIVTKIILAKNVSLTTLYIMYTQHYTVFFMKEGHTRKSKSQIKKRKKIVKHLTTTTTAWGRNQKHI